MKTPSPLANWLRKRGYRTLSEYLQSRGWKIILEKFRQRAGWRCRICHQPGRHVHLRNRKLPTLTGADPEGLILLCEDCRLQILHEPDLRPRPSRTIKKILNFLLRRPEKAADQSGRVS